MIFISVFSGKLENFLIRWKSH